MTAAVPRKLLLSAKGIELAKDAALGLGMLFLPAEETRAEEVLGRCLESNDLKVLCWRDVPICTDCLGEIALSTMPKIRQVLVGDAESAGDSSFERRLYLARKQFEKIHEKDEITGYICSLSSKTVVYKAMCTGVHLADYYQDLASPDFVTPFALVSPAVCDEYRAYVGSGAARRTLAHNGEINTVWGNRVRMTARDSTLPVECKPILTKGGTDSTSLDEAVELISMNGRTLAEAVRMLIPPAAEGHQRSMFLRYHSACAEPWDGPAAIAYTDGRVVGAALDRNGLRPCRFAITSDGLVVAGSEAGLVRPRSGEGDREWSAGTWPDAGSRPRSGQGLRRRGTAGSIRPRRNVCTTRRDLAAGGSASS